METTFTQKTRKNAELISKKITEHPMITAIVLCLFFFLAAMVFCDPKYESNDDFWTDTVLSGVWTGEYDQHLLFSNILIGYVLKGIYTLIPFISFYFVFLEILGLLSSIVIVWLILNHCRPSIGLLASVIFLTCFSDDLFILVQFTKIAAAAIAAGGFLFLEGIFDKSLAHGKAAVISGVLLFLTGSMLRIDCIYSVLPFLFIHFLLLVYKKPVKQMVISLLLCISLLCVSFGLQTVNNVLWDIDPDYRTFRELDTYRYPITDVPRPAYEEIQPELEEIGITGVDYYMAVVWGFTDLSVFKPDTLKRFGDVLKEYNSVHTSTFSNAISNMSRRAYWSYPGFLGLILLVVLLAFSERKKQFTIISTILTCFALLFYFAYIGRMVYRVEFGILFSAFSALALPLGRNTREIPIKENLMNFALITVMCAVFLNHLGTYFPDTSYKTMDDQSYSEYVDTIFGAPGYHLSCYNTPVSKRRPHEELLEIIEKDDYHFYLIDEEVLVNLNLDYKPWIRPDQCRVGKNSHNLGGCHMMQFPGETYAFVQNNIDPVDPYKSLINDNIYVVDNEFYMLKLAYIQYHYYPDAQIAYVGEASGRKIWKYYLPE